SPSCARRRIVFTASWVLKSNTSPSRTCCSTRRNRTQPSRPVTKPSSSSIERTAEAKENLLERIQAESRAIDGERHHYGCLVLGGALCGCACRVRRSSRRIEGTACAARAAC